MPQKTNLQSAFYMEPEEIVDFFKSKGLKTSYNWHEVYAQAHAKAFTVAKMTELDLLKDTQNLLAKSIQDGGGYNEFKRDAQKLFEKKGWVGVQEVTNPHTGEIEKVELGTQRRIQTIYTNNINSAYAAGRYREQLEESDTAPYWQYMTLADGNVRPSHRAMHGKVFRADDPFWDTFYPPNGWNCRCFVRNLTKRMVENMGLKVESSTGKISTVKEAAADEIKEIPVYKFDTGGQVMTLKPDAGWETNTGVHAWGIDVAAWNKVEAMPEKIKYDFISKMAGNRYKKEVVNNIISNTLKRENYASRGVETAITWFNPQIMTALNNENIPLISPVVVFGDRQVKHSLNARKVAKQRLTEKQFKNIYDYVNNPDEIFIDTVKHNIVYVSFLPKSEITDNRDCIKIPVEINSKNKKRPVNYIATTGRVNYKTTFTTNKRYKKIE